MVSLPSSEEKVWNVVKKSEQTSRMAEEVRLSKVAKFIRSWWFRIRLTHQLRLLVHQSRVYLIIYSFLLNIPGSFQPVFSTNQRYFASSYVKRRISLGVNFFVYSDVLPGKLTCLLKINGLKEVFPIWAQEILFRWHVSFRFFHVAYIRSNNWFLPQQLQFPPGKLNAPNCILHPGDSICATV